MAVIIIIVSFSNSDILNSKWQIITLLFSIVKYLTQAASENFRSACWSNNESRDSIDCFYGCLEGPSIFLESSILLRVLIFACREGEIVAVMAWLVPPPSLSDACISQLFLV